ncbi:acetyl-CoA carboxylase biotin carboxyl carrier protein subunit [Enterococcus gallinarum]|uniref:acetyl-CoA carboxylase biotin carboxyl carrier protein subunit n=1 Tax=Enterococcus gallinarum TaxID=1353 RepID=UPI0022E5F23E|nr:acetyl-CoA carboxylase biotin carboxyl carrier protein subunit [Enterococcus gallinarum]
MLRKFRIRIDGKDYLVEMEEIGNRKLQEIPQQAVKSAASSEVEKSVSSSISTPVEAPDQTSNLMGENDAITAPMPGTILKVLVNIGDSVTENQPLMILEAMKMENEIVAGKSGTVVGIHVSQGDVVNPGDSLITIN